MAIPILSSASSAVLADAWRLLMSASELVSNAGQFGTNCWRLAVGCYSTLAPIMMPRVIAGLAERHPGIELDFMEGSDASLERTLREGSCEIAVLYNYQFPAAGCRRTSPSTLSPPLHLTWSCPPGTGSPAGTRSLEEVLAEPLILFDLEPGGEYFLGIFHHLGLTPQIRLRTASYEMVLALVARGLGYPCSPRRPRSRPPRRARLRHCAAGRSATRAPDRGGTDRLGPAHEEGPGIPGPVPGVVRPGHRRSRVAPVAVRA